MKDSKTDRMWISSREAFDAEFRYDRKDLGAVCQGDRTVFKVWSPFAERVELRLYRKGERDAFLEKEMERETRGVWKLEFPENLHGVYYDYLVRNQGKDVRTADPYARGCDCNGRRSMAVDLKQTNPPGFDEDNAPPKKEEQIIYELHIKDFSYDRESGAPEEYRGKYKAFSVREEGRLPLCMKYLTELGITHVQLMPFFDFASVDEGGDDSQFNWGYDPLNYNVPEGSYSTNPYDGAVRIRECKEMIQALHQRGIRVVMDVVYNHTFSGDSWLERMVPGYYYRHREDGILANGSACGNDIAAGRSMVDNYILDSVLYWAREYHIDGFRFDLMGLLTVELMNRIRRELDAEFGPGQILVYGEPWRAEESPMEKGTAAALKENTALLEDGVGIFCDDTRDVIKGDVFHGEIPGFVNGGAGLEGQILHAVTGWRDGGAGFVPKSCRQIINYVSVHDNFTLWDKLVLTMHKELRQFCRKEVSQAEDGGVGVCQKDGSQTGGCQTKGCQKGDFIFRHEDVLAANKLAAFIYFTCQGNLLMQAGEEFGRTKLGEHNSYCSAPEVNMLRWRQIWEFADLVDYYKGLIALRKKLPGLCDKSPDGFRRISHQKIHGEGVVSFWVENGISWTDHGNFRTDCGASREDDGFFEVKNEVSWTDCGDTQADNCPVRERNAVFQGDHWEELYIIYNASASECFLELWDKEAPGGDTSEEVWEILADGQETDCRKPLPKAADGRVRVGARSGLLLGRKAKELDTARESG